MNQAFGQVVPFAIVIALSPIPLIAVIAMLFSRRAVGNGIGFLLGWFVGVAGGLAVLTALASTQDLGSSDDPSSTSTGIRLVLGVLLLGAAFRAWHGRPRPGDDVPLPKWMKRVDGIHPVGAFVLAVLLGGVNPKNLLMNVAAAAVLAATSLDTSDAVAVIALYTAVASCTVILAVAYRIVLGTVPRRPWSGCAAGSARTARPSWRSCSWCSA